MRPYTKYPRTMNLPFSGSNSSDDVWLKNCSNFSGKKVVVTQKLDGENTNMYSNHFHARSIDGTHGVGRSWVKALHGQICHEISPHWKIAGENVYAAHSIWYWDLPTYFFVFGIFDIIAGEDWCLHWDDVETICEVLGLQTAPMIYRGIYDQEAIDEAFKSHRPFRSFDTPKDHIPVEKPNPTNLEGYVIRLAESFPTSEFPTSVAKWVRPNHIQTDQHWASLPVLPNRLARKESRQDEG